MAAMRKTKRKVGRPKKKMTPEEVFKNAVTPEPEPEPEPPKRQSVYIFFAQKSGLTIRNPLYRPNPQNKNELHSMIVFRNHHFRTRDYDLGEALIALSEADQRAGAARFVSIKQEQKMTTILRDGISVENVAPVEKKIPTPMFTAPKAGEEPDPFTTNMEEQDDVGDFAPAPGTPPTQAETND